MRSLLLLITLLSVSVSAETFKIHDADSLKKFFSVSGVGTVSSPHSFGVTMIDPEGKSPMSTIFGELTVGQRRDDVSVQFQYSNSTADVVETVSGTGTTGNANSMASVSSGVGIGSSILQSKDTVRYRPGHEGVSMFTTVYEGSEAGVDQKHGLLNGTDGLAFGYQDTEFGIWFVSGGVETFITQSNWSEDPANGTGESGCNINPAFMNIYKVSFGWLGIAPISYSIFCGSDLGWVNVHTIDLTNSQAEPHLKNPSLPVSMRVDRVSGSGSDITIRSSSWRSGVIGEAKEDNASDRWSSHTVLEAAVSGSGTRNAIFTVCNKATYQGLTNHVVTELGIISFTNDGNKPIAFYGVTNAVISGGGAFSDINTANSVLEVSDGGTITSGGRGPATVMQQGTDRRSDVRGTGIRIYPNDCLTVEAVAQTAFSGTVSISARFLEKF